MVLLAGALTASPSSAVASPLRGLGWTVCSRAASVCLHAACECDTGGPLRPTEHRRRLESESRDPCRSRDSPSELGQRPSVTRALPHAALEGHVREALLIEATPAAREHVHAYTNCCERTKPSRAWGKAQPRTLAATGR